MPKRPWIDDFSSGYMQRVMHRFPMQGDREPWLNPQNYNKDKKMIRFGEIDDGVLEFVKQPARKPAVEPERTLRAVEREGEPSAAA